MLNQGAGLLCLDYQNAGPSLVLATEGDVKISLLLANLGHPFVAPVAIADVSKLCAKRGASPEQFEPGGWLEETEVLPQAHCEVDLMAAISQLVPVVAKLERPISEHALQTTIGSIINICIGQSQQCLPPVRIIARAVVMHKSLGLVLQL